ncbi:MAG: ribosome maturation factor RimP [Gordonia sp. (in: high G+C Gram-positive bacteria)]|uniref:ribosome maturation factor RimP n=1 Tax=Gordonia sp. (in: high G+C Gram-positive bacteria) TaxID=84139 RepID=UPI0039E3EA38
MSETAQERIRDVVGPIAESLGYDLEDVVVKGPATHREVRITVDRDGGASLDALAEVSRAFSEALDDTDLFDDDPYDLEVSTPGIGRPLTLPRHWRRNRGRRVALTRTGEDAPSEVLGRICDVDDDAVTLLHNVKGRMSTTVVPFAEIERAVIEVDFTRPGPAELRRCGLDDDEIARRREPAG